MSKIKVTKQDLMDLYINDQSASMQDVADKLDTTRGTVHRAMKRHGLKAKPPGTRPAKVIPELDDREWLRDQLRVKSMNQIAKELGISVGRVSSRMYTYGIACPSADRSKAAKRSLKKRYPNGRYGADASNWKGGRVQEKRGYVMVYQPDHPHAKNGVYVYEHRLVAERMLGRYLEPDEIVHHINGIRDDNRPENLQVLGVGEHITNHWESGHEVVALREENERLRSRIAELEKALKG